MIRRAFGLLLIILIGGLVGILIAHAPGYVLLSYGGKSIETSLWVLLFLLLLLYLSLSLIGRLIRFLLAMPARTREWWQRRKLIQHYRITLDGLQGLLAGDLRLAKYRLTTTVEESDTPLLHFISLAETAQGLGHEDEYEDWLKKAAQEGKTGQTVAAISLAESLVQKGEYKLAHAQINNAAALAPKHPRLKKLKALLGRDD